MELILPWQWPSPLLLPPVLLCGLLLFYFYTILWRRPERVRQELRRQGVRGPHPCFLYGNIPEMKRIQEQANRLHQEQGAPSEQFSSNYVASLFPYFLHWSKVYGSMYLYSTGSLQVLNVTDPDMVKALANCKSLELGKPSYLQKERRALLGVGILTANGDLWAHERKVIAPEFFMDKIKGMVHLMVEAAMPMLNSWESLLEREGGSVDIVVDEYLRNFSADVISRVSFGSSFTEGKEIFLKIRHLQVAMAKKGVLIGIPGSRYLPTKSNRAIWSLDRQIRALVLDIARKHEQGPVTSSNNDLLHSVVEGAKASSLAPCTPEDFIVDNCKNIYFAGHETTATTASWCLLLLASHPEWQDRARREVLEVCQGRRLDSDMLRKLKTLTMVIQETLRLYPPASFVNREALRDMKLGNLGIPKGTNLKIPIALVHRDSRAWGPDPDKFDPGRFAGGIAGACRPPQMYMPFGLGLRTCIGQNLAMAELKVVLSLLLASFAFAVSPGYVHCPAFRLTIEPGNGMALTVSRRQ